MERIKRLIIRLILPIMALLVLFFALSKVSGSKIETDNNQQPEPISIPSGSLFQNQIAGIGIIEPRSEKISVGTEVSGIISAIKVKVGDKVKKGDILFELDSTSLESQIKAAKAYKELAYVELLDAQQELDMFESVNKKAVSRNEIQRKRYKVKLANAKVNEADAKIKVLQTSVNQTKVKSPIFATILRINIRPGEYAQAGQTATPIMVIGDIDVMHVRVEIDETEVLKVSNNASAKGFLRGAPNKPIDLYFIRKEPFVVPKKSLTGDGNERVDTRMMEVIYSFDNAQISSLVGQMMDVYIEVK